MALDLLTTGRRHSEPFKAGRESAWSDENPIIADGMLLDVFHDALQGTFEALDALNSARRAPAETTDRWLDGAEKCLRDALAQVSELRQRVAAVPAEFGDL